MPGRHHGDVQAVEVAGAAHVEGDGVDAFGIQHVQQVYLGRDGGAALSGQGESVAQMVAVAVGDQDQVGMILRQRLGTGGIAGDEGIYHHGGIIGKNAEAGMSLKGDLHFDTPFRSFL